uniref:Uncharacterized protein n=1 Tax=Timema douglasi TaxID=61478 RepID=A0A7R8VB50_TIMDO|nr:unnamed protein product [Timema douglasi]
MTLEDIPTETMDAADRQFLRKTLMSVLRRAESEKRLTCGMLPTLKTLEVDPCSALFCIIPQSLQCDSALHIHTVLLQAFCYENNIHIIKWCCQLHGPLFQFVGSDTGHESSKGKGVDSAEKLANIIGGKKKNKRLDSSCVLIHQTWSTDQPDMTDQPNMTDTEKELVDFCDRIMDDIPVPVIKNLTKKKHCLGRPFQIKKVVPFGQEEKKVSKCYPPDLFLSIATTGCSYPCDKLQRSYPRPEANMRTARLKKRWQVLTGVLGNSWLAPYSLPCPYNILEQSTTVAGLTFHLELELPSQFGFYEEG